MKADKEKRNRLISAVFIEAQKLRIDTSEEGDLRSVIVPNLCGGKRLSRCNTKEVFKVLDYLVGQKHKRIEKKYTSSRKGLIEELEDAAKARWGEEFEKPLNAFINSHRKTPTHYRFLDVTTMKGIKERIKEMNGENISHRDTETQRKTEK